MENIVEKISYISLMSNKVKKFGGINLAQGLPGFAPPEELIDILNRISAENVHQYAPSNGNIKLVGLLREKYEPYTEENIMVTNGATEAISLIFTYLNGIMAKNRTAIGFDPVYESFSRLPEIFGRKYVSFPLKKDFSVDFDMLERTVAENKVGLIFVNSPGNPYGKIWTDKEFLKLKEISEKHKVFVLADCVYSEIYFNKKPFQPLFDSEYFFYVNSFSKLLSITGWRVGYLICSKSHIANMRLIHDYTGLSSPSILQESIALYLDKYDFGKKYVAGLRKKMKTSFELLSGKLKNCGFEIPRIEGGYFIWAKLPKGFDDCLKFSMDLYDKKKVATVPGIHFSDEGQKFVRFNIARPVEEIEKAGELIKEFVSENRK
jgi:aspartate/methionine/tyrosine aminotransferase